MSYGKRGLQIRLYPIACSKQCMKGVGMECTQLCFLIILQKMTREYFVAVGAVGPAALMSCFIRIITF